MKRYRYIVLITSRYSPNVVVKDDGDSYWFSSKKAAEKFAAKMRKRFPTIKYGVFEEAE